MQEQSIFIEALERTDPVERVVFLDRACGQDSVLRRRIERLLQRHQQADSFLDDPFVAPADTLETLGERPGTVIGPYKLLEQIGEGGFGVVFMAEQTQPVRRKVALKVLKPGMDTKQIIARFEAERQALALMDHPYIARVFDGGATAAGRPYFVMELVRGTPITGFCDQNRLAIPQRLELFVGVCQAVQHAHQKGIIHRDLKPSNILVTVHDTTPVVKIIDFGIAKAVGQELTDKTCFTSFAQMVGTPQYMSPEQAGQSGLDIDTRSDIYSLGVLLYELLTGTTPCDKEQIKTAGLDEICRIIREEEAPRPSTRMSTLGQAATTRSTQRKSDPKRLSQLFRGELDWIVMKALEKDRSRRYESASTFAADVQRYLRDEPVQACPPSAGYRLRKFLRRNNVVVGVAGLVLFFLVLMGAGLGAAWRDRADRRAKLHQDVSQALDDAARARGLALKLTDNPYSWKATLAEAASEFKRAEDLAAEDEAALNPAIQERLRTLQALLNADEADRRFAARFDEIRLDQCEVNVATNEFRMDIAFAALQDAFQRHYRITFGATPVEQAVAVIQQRPKAIQDILLGALVMGLDYVPKDYPRTAQWLMAVRDAADTGPWRKRLQQARQASDWTACERIVEEVVRSQQPPSVLLRLARDVPWKSSIRLKLLRRIQDAYPGDFWSNHDLANELHYGSPPHLEEALRYYTAALALRPHNPGVHVSLGNALRRKGDLDGAIRAYHQALARHPNYFMAYLDLGLALEAKGDVDGGIAAAHQAIRFRGHADEYVLLGGLLERKGLLEKALACYRKAIDLDPKYLLAYNRLGVALNNAGRRDKAVASFRKAIAHGPTYTLAYYNLGITLDRMGHTQEAIACYRKANEINGDLGCRNNLAWILVTCANRKFRNLAEGLTLAEKNIVLAPNDGLSWNTLGVAYYRTRNWKEAIAALQKSLQLRNGGDSYDYFFLAMACWQLGKKAKARQWFDRGVRWMDKNRPRGEEFGRFRAEAADLLKIDANK